MNEQKRKNILEIYLSGKMDPQLNEIVKGWLAGEIDDFMVETVLVEYFDARVTYRRPTADTYRRLKELEKRLGFPASKKTHAKPFPQRLSVRVAAVLLPVIIAVGIGFYYMDVIPGRKITPVIADVVADTTPGTEVQIELPAVEEAPVVAVNQQEDEPIARRPRKEQRAEKKNERIAYDINISAPQGRHRYVRLPDNSTVLINNGGQIAYSSANREVFLHGEAYFKVAKGNTLPFTVKTEQLTVNVTGTEFNIKALPRSEETVVGLVEGSVNIHTGDENVNLKPMDELTLAHRNRKFKLAEIEGNCWWKSPLSFDGCTLRDMLERLEECYGLLVDGKEHVANDVQYTIKFDKMTPVEHILDVMKEIAPGFEYDKNGSAITVSMGDIE